MQLMFLLRKYASAVYTFLLLLGRLLVLCVVVAGPWKNGGADLEYQRFFLWLALGSGICAFGTLLLAPLEKRKETNLFPALIVSIPLILGLALCVLQVTPLSDKTLAKASPHVLELREFLTPTLEDDTTNGDEENSESLTRFSEAVFPLSDDSKFNVKEALAIESSFENKLAPELPTWGNTISVYPLTTCEWIPLFWGGLLLFFSTAVLFNSSKSRKILFIVAAVVGTSFALLCLMFQANPAAREFPMLAFLTPKDSDFKLGFGTYLNKNCCGGYLVYCLAPCIFLAGRVFLKSARLLKEEREDREKEEDTYYELRRDSKWKIVLGDFFDLFNRRLVFWLSFVVILFATIVVSMSRGATVAAFAVILGSFVFLACKKECRRYWYVFLLVGVAVAGVVEAVGLTQRVEDRMATIFEEDEKGETAVDHDLRLENWRAAFETSRDYYWFGSGLGTYPLVNGANDVLTKIGILFYYAENSFVQNLVEMGRVGALLFIVEYLLLFLCFGRLLWKARSSEQYAISVGGIVLIVGQLITSSTDLGIYLSGNLTTFAVFCGAFLSFKKKESLGKEKSASREEARSGRSLKRTVQSEKVGWGSVGVSLGVLAVCVLAGGWTLQENKDYIRRYSLLKESKFTAEQYVTLSGTSLDALIERFEQYVQYRDDSAEIRNRLAELEIARYRLKLFEFLKEQRPSVDQAQLWNGTALPIRLQTLLKYQEIGFDVAVSSIRENQFAQDAVAPATINSITARHICPLIVKTYLALSEEAPLTTDLSWKQNQALIELYARRVLLLGKYDSTSLFNAGFYLGSAGLKSLQTKFWNRTLEFSEKNLKSVLTLIGADTPTDDLKKAVADVLPDVPRILALAPGSLGGELKGTPLYEAIVERSLSYFENIPEEEKDAEYYFSSGIFFTELGDYQRADENLQKACEMDPNNYYIVFTRVDLLNKYADVLHKEEECVRLLQEFRVGKFGRLLTRCNEKLKIAEQVLKRNQTVKTFQKFNETEKRLDEKFKNDDSSSESTNQ